MPYILYLEGNNRNPDYTKIKHLSAVDLESAKTESMKILNDYRAIERNDEVIDCAIIYKINSGHALDIKGLRKAYSAIKGEIC